MSTTPQPEYKYQEFTAFVRRFDQDQMLRAVAQVAASLPDDASRMPYRQTPPWALAGVAKASIIHGNPFRSTMVRPADLQTACRMYSNLDAQELQAPGLNSGRSQAVIATPDRMILVSGDWVYK